MNRKGFAISTLIYGLSIMGILLMTILMGIMSVNRANNRKLSDSIEEDLTRFNRTVTTFSISESSAEQIYSVPEDESGWYRIELAGAAGNNGYGGYGAYTFGVIELEEGDRLIFNVGKMTGTYGEATDVRLISGNSAKAFNSRIMVAAGGGKNSGADGGTLTGYTPRMKSTGGTLNITNGKYTLKSSTLIGNASTYLEDGIKTSISSGLPSYSNTGEGGRGFLNGTNANMGGTSFIAGYAGCKGISIKPSLALNNNPIVYQEATEINEETGQYIYPDGQRGYYFVDGMMFAGVNKGNGFAKIERVVKKTKKAQTLTRKNKKLNGVTKIKDCVDGSGNSATKISAVAKGVDYTIGKSPTTEGSCKSVTLPSTDLDEIAIWHNKSGVDYKKHTITVISNEEEKIIKEEGTGTTFSETETPTGYRVSAYQYDATTTFPTKGNYYLMPVLSENKVVSAPISAKTSSSPVTMDYLKGDKIQKWSIELITNTKVSTGYKANDPKTYEYKIVDLARFYALEIISDENMERNKLAAATAFNSKRRNDPQIWKITPIKNGTYTITTSVSRFQDSLKTGNILPQFDSAISDANLVIIGVNNSDGERFKLISVDYSGTN